VPPAPAAKHDAPHPLCRRVLGRLPSLSLLHLTNATAPDLRYNPDLCKFRPLLPSLETVAMDHFRSRVTMDHAAANVAACLHVLARWTAIPAATVLRLQLPGHLAVKGWGAGWLPAALASTDPEAAVVLVDDNDVDHYLAALLQRALSGRDEGGKHSVLLGQCVSPGGFGRVLCAAHLPSKALHIGDGDHAAQPYYLGWTAGLRLRASQLFALARVSAPGLESLRIADCSLLKDKSAAVLVSAAPGLRQLRQEGAARLTDRTLFALPGCRRLEALHLGGPAKITADGVVVLVVLLKDLREVSVSGLLVQALVAGVQGWMAHQPPALRWNLSQGPDGRSAAWTRPLQSSVG
jgi:hypothetical protein